MLTTLAGIHWTITHRLSETGHKPGMSWHPPSHARWVLSHTGPTWQGNLGRATGSPVRAPPQLRGHFPGWTPLAVSRAPSLHVP